MAAILQVLAVQAKALTQNFMIQAAKLELLEPRGDKYFRIFGKVIADGQEVALELIKAGLARAYDGGNKERWCPL